MFIKVINKAFQQISSYERDASFYLEQNDWNDYGYYTTYYLHLSSKHTKDKQPILIGSVKILKLAQEEGEQYLIPRGELTSLNEDFCSLGQSLDYYQRIAQLPADLRDQILLALRDIVIHPEFEKEFVDEPGWHSSLFRSLQKSDDIFTIAPMYILENFQHLPSLDLKFTFQTSGMEIPMEFDFDAGKYGWDGENSLPNRIAVIIGRNGSGKSTLLSKISRVAYASTSDRKDWLQGVGQLLPDGLGFPKIVNLSYSAFDSFQVPGIYRQEKEQICKDIKNGTGRYVFCGIRDIARELEDYMGNMKTDANGRLDRSSILEDKYPNTHLKSTSDLTNEFYELVSKVKAGNRETDLDEAFSILSAEPSMHNYNTDSYVTELDKENLLGFFSHLSTGHKFVFHSIANIVAHIEPRTLVLFDEPETHLHPPMLAVLMKAIRHILNKKNAFMIVATHSPVLLQETLCKHVYIVRREGAQMKINKPDMQTFGENIGLITSTVFGLSSDISDYHYELDRAIKWFKGRYSPDPDNLMKQIEALFENDLSMQARAYVLSKIYKN